MWCGYGYQLLSFIIVKLIININGRLINKFTALVVKFLIFFTIKPIYYVILNTISIYLTKLSYSPLELTIKNNYLNDEGDRA